jgi:hypothetical protein
MYTNDLYFIIYLISMSCCMYTEVVQDMMIKYVLMYKSFVYMLYVHRGRCIYNMYTNDLYISTYLIIMSCTTSLYIQHIYQRLVHYYNTEVVQDMMIKYVLMYMSFVCMLYVHRGRTGHDD